MKLLNPKITRGLFCILFYNFFLIRSTVAQMSAGLEGGYNKNYLSTNNANRAFTNYEPLSGFNLGASLQYKISNWFAIAVEPSYVQKNYSQQRSAFFSGVYENSYNNYIDMPVMAHFIFGSHQLQGFINAGMYAGYWISGRVKGVSPNILDITPADNTSTNSVFDFENPYSYSEKYNFDTKRDNRIEAGWIGGLGISYDVTSRYQVFAEGRMLYTFSDQQKNYMVNQVPRYNTTYEINAGVMFHFSDAPSK